MWRLLFHWFISISCASLDKSEERWQGDWLAVVPLLLAKREGFGRPLSNEPWERKLAWTSTVVGLDGFPSSNKLFHPHIYLGLFFKSDLPGFWFSSRAHIHPPTLYMHIFLNSYLCMEIFFLKIQFF